MGQISEVREIRLERVEAPARSRLGRRMASLGNLWGYVLVLPSVFLYIIFEIWPIIRGLLMAFSPYSWVIPETKGLLVFNGLDNYRELFRTQEWQHSMWVAAKFTAGAWPLNFVVAMFVAVMISKVANPRWSGFFRIVTYLPVVVPMATAMLLWQNLYSPQYGYINYFLRMALRIKNAPLWIYNPSWALFSTVIAVVWKNFGHNTLMFLVGIYSINRELYEAAEIDGAGELQQFWNVTLPLLKPVVVLVLVLGARVVSATGEVMVLFKSSAPGWDGLGLGGPHQSALTAGLWAYMTAFIRPDMRMGLAASSSLILGLISMVLSGIVFKLLRVERV